MEWGRKWLVDFNVRKTQLVSLDESHNTGAIYVKMNGSFLEEKSSFKIQGFSFSPNLNSGSYIISIVKTASKKIRALIRSMKFLPPQVALYFYKSTIRFARNTVVMSGIVLLTATWNFQISHKNGYAGLLVLHLLILLNH